MTLRVPDSSLASRLEPGLGYRQGKLAARKHEPNGIVVHTTGAGPFRRWREKPESFASPAAAAVHIYAQIMPESGHYVIDGDTGEITQIVPELWVAWHVGSSKTQPYRVRDWAARYDCAWWLAAMPGFSSPLDLPVWHDGSCNANTIGIEVAPPKAGPLAPWSNSARDSLAKLIADLERRHNIPHEHAHVMSHSEAHPIARTASGQPWDPAPDRWGWERFGRAS